MLYKSLIVGFRHYVTKELSQILVKVKKYLDTFETIKSISDRG